MLQPVIYFFEQPTELTELVHYFSGRWGDHKAMLKDECVLCERVLDQSALDTLEDVKQISDNLLLLYLVMGKL